MALPQPPSQPALLERPALFERQWGMRILAGALIIAAAVALGVVIGRSFSRPAVSKPPVDSSLGIPY